MTSQVEPAGRIYREQGLSAVVHRACRHPSCQAPGVYTSAEHVRKEPKWSACYVNPSDNRNGQPVGPMCPACGRDRGPTLINRLGEIWRRKFS